MVYTTYIDPMITLVQRYFEQRRTLATNQPDQGKASEIQTGSPDWQEDLPDSPCLISRDALGRVSRCVYGDFEGLTLGVDQDLLIWQEEIVRNAAGKTAAILTTYPDGSVRQDTILRGEGGVVTGVI